LGGLRTVSDHPAILTRGLTKTYQGDFWKRPITALRGLDLQVERGEIFGFIGPNGAGKTTALKVLVGLHRPTSGMAQVLGRDLDDPSGRAKIGFLPERPYFYQHLTARELMRFYGQLLDLRGAELNRQVGALLDRVDLARVASDPLSSYSKGMLQRVGLAQALLGDPELIILDEPMSGLDPMGRALVRDVILEERERGRTVFFSSHILHDVETLCTRVAVVIGGRLKGVGPVAELIGSQTTHVELVVIVGDDAALPGERVRDALVGDDRRIHQRVPPERVDSAIAAVHAAGGRVLEVHPVRRTLEDVFVGAVKEARPDGGTGAEEGP
jgi:ABC-2 type transport system ATP-binding protein